jgi:hypothetical protein
MTLLFKNSEEIEVNIRPIYSAKKRWRERLFQNVCTYNECFSLFIPLWLIVIDQNTLP